MENRAHALIAGVFVIILGIAIGLAAMWFSRSNIQLNTYLIATHESVSGLSVQSAVHYRGVNIGKVENIEFDPDDSQQILIHIAIDEDVILRNTVYAQLGYQGVTGLAYIQLNDDGIGVSALPSSVMIPMRRSLFEEVAVSGQDLLNNVNQLTIKMHQLLDEDNRKSISHTLKNVEHVTSNFSAITGRLEPVMQSFHNLAAQSATLIKRLDELLAEMNVAIIKANQKEGVFDSLSQSAQELIHVIPELQNASNSIFNSTRNLDRFLHHLEEHPQSLLFGRPSALPGPGEQGFTPPKENNP